ncbi:MAG TPA: cytochrome P450 [Acidimicrobiales bacterium]|nr:cytochrome P450 [Acidimicrobiales bacterium]
MSMEFNPYSRELHEDPYPVYRWMREEAPLYRNDELDFWALSRFDDLWTVVHDPETYSSARGVTLTANAAEADDEGMADVLPVMIQMDPPRHDELRKLVKGPFTPRQVGRLEDSVRRIARELLANFVEHGEANLVADFAAPLPTMVIADMLGVDRADLPMFRRCSDAVIRGDSDDRADRRAAVAAGQELAAYFSHIVADRRQDPRDDLVTQLAHSHEGDARLSELEILGFCFLLLAAGNETTMNLISNSAVLLDRYRDQRALLVDDPSLMRDAIEELLRYDSPVQVLVRTTTRDVELYGEVVPADSKVALVFGAANRDDREFDDPDRLDLRRRPERHLAFGHGVHYCLGAALARLEGKVAYEELLAHIPDFSVTTDHVERVHTGIIRGVERLPIAFTPARVAA